MDDTPDPSAQFFPGLAPEEINLYATLNLTREASLNDIKTSYRKLALKHHPDKQTTRDAGSQKQAHEAFQQIGFAYAILSDENRRSRYDKTGRTDEGGLEPGEGGWEAYFEDLFDKVTRSKLDEMKKDYQGSEEERSDLRDAYVNAEGFIDGIMSEIPHSTYEDESRFTDILKTLIERGDIPSLPSWEAGLKDSKGRQRRKMEGRKEAKEAEEHARELGVWDEFYGSGKVGSRTGKAKAGQDADDESVLKALILKKRGTRESAFDNLLAKYGGDLKDSRKQPPKRKLRKAAEEDAESDIPPSKRTKGTSSTGRTGVKR